MNVIMIACINAPMKTMKGKGPLQVKCKAVKYLVKCIEKLLKLPNDEGRLSMFMDLSIRLERWRRQGREVFEGSEVLTDVIRDLHSKISPSRDAWIGGDSLQ
ncbi:hypothetical protein MRB53_012721 [Persea americana]|uniref:Uncharacterized protein n=1 Tax=Persea americana TaxID=3435 RepID=A0ACC2LYC6_PERAE|nr:hypothetical protein MRB53_012721 [Persea americana]